jgi:HEAT repeat protein
VALGLMGKEGVPALVTALRQDNAADVRLNAAASLAKLGSDAKGAVADLAKALQDGSPDVRQTAASTLGGLGPTRRRRSRRWRQW